MDINTSTKQAFDGSVSLLMANEVTKISSNDFVAVKKPRFLCVGKTMLLEIDVPYFDSTADFFGMNGGPLASLNANDQTFLLKHAEDSLRPPKVTL